MGQIILDEKNFSINSDGWKISKCSEKINSTDFLEIEEKINPEGDIWEFGEEQYFTFESGNRELRKAGKIIPTLTEWKELFKKPENLPLPLGVRCQKNGNFYYADIGEHGHYLAPDSETGFITIPKHTNQLGIDLDDIVGYTICCLKN